MRNKINTIIWDWNGTLLNDIDICIQSINSLLKDRNLPIINQEKYHEVFDFPIIDYYKRLGFDFEKEPFEIPAHQFIEQYTSKVPTCLLHDGTESILKSIESKGLKQVILSASETQALKSAVNHFNIEAYFDRLAGLDNHYANSKVDIGLAMLHELGIDPKTTCLIGDTTHDFEVAEALKCQCILIADGHQSRTKLEQCNVKVLDNIKELEELF